jgi:hypothetical protein
MNSEIEFYRFVGDILAEALLGEGEKYVSPYEGRHLKGKPPTHAERQDMQDTIAKIKADSNKKDAEKASKPKT